MTTALSPALCASRARAQEAAETALLHAATQAFFAAYQRKDVEGLLELWSTKAPELAAFVAEVRQTFPRVGGVELKGVAVRRVTAEGAEAVVRVAVEMHAAEVKTGQPAAGFGKLNRTLRFVKEDGRWKLWAYAASENELAQALASAETERNQAALLEAEPELQTAELRRALLRQGELSVRGGDHPRALRVFNLARALAERLGDKAGIVSALGHLGRLAYTQGDYPRALRYFEQSLPLAATDKAATARTLHSIGTIRRLLSDYPQAREYLQRSLALAEELDDRATLPLVLNSLGALYREQGDYARALGFFQRSLALGEALGDKELTGLPLNNIGTIHGAQGNHAQALEYFRRSFALGEASGDKSLMAHALNNIGITYYSQKDYGRALEYYQKSLALREVLGDQRTAALTLNNIGIIHREQGDYPRALEYYQKSLTLREQLGDQAGTAAALNHIGIIHHLQANHAQALEIAARVVELATRLASPELLWRGHELAGRANRALGRPEEARRAFSDSVETIEGMRHRVGGGELARQRFFEDKLPPYLAMIDLLISLGQPGEALAYAERAKARALLDVVRNGRVHITKAMTPEEQEQERALNAELTGLNAQLHNEGQRLRPDRTRIAELERRREQSRLAYEAFLTGLYVKHPELRVQRGETAPITAASAAELLPDAETALLEFVVAKEKSYLLVLTRAGRRKVAGQLDIRVYPLAVTAGQLSEHVERFRGMLADRDQGYQEPARELYDLLLKPAEGQLAGKKMLCIVPDQALWELPFQALQPRAGVHLIEDYALFYAPSLGVLREAVKRRAASTARLADRRRGPAKDLLALGNPLLTGETVAKVKAVHRDEPLGPLPEAEREVKTLSRFYGATNSHVFIGAEAREGRVKADAPNYAILHFATHGLLDDRNPMYSHLTLARTAEDPHEDGLLEAREIINLDLRAKLAVLSACQMARGRVGAGEGMIGMSWAFFVAGVPTTVASQWKVDSASTTSLMIDFHRRLTAQGFPARAPNSKAEALRQAALSLSRDARYKHPFYWAGFVMVGDGW